MGLKIEKMAEMETVFDLTVEDNHNFYANDILVHNCIEIMQPANEERSPVCCLSSVNLGTWDEWKNDENFIPDLVEFLDCVMESFIKNAPDELSKSKFAAIKERSLGLGAMGWHTLLQSKMMAFGSKEAKELNIKIFKEMHRQGHEKSVEIGEKLGFADDTINMKERRRNANIFAIAPNASSSTLLGVSPSIEPIKCNAYVHRTRNGTAGIKNQKFKEILQQYDKDTESVWGDIVANKGSVQHLNFLTDNEREVFKTAIEINQFDVVDLASDRGPFICQSQSLNMFFKSKEDKAHLIKVHNYAWEKKVKSMYYLRTEASNRADNIGEKVDRVKLQIDSADDECTACEG